MKLVFLGTRGNIDRRTGRHRRHASTLVTYRGRSVMLDCGEDWLGRFEAFAPRAIVITHAHPDHVLGLSAGSPCPVYASRDAWRAMGGFPIARAFRRTLTARRARTIEGMMFTPFPVEHSVRAPAVGYRIEAGRVAIFYVPDVAWIRHRSAALAGVRVYIGDGATVVRPIIRRDQRTLGLTGHIPIRTQLAWCREAGVPRMIVTHCGSEIVASDERRIAARLRKLAREQGVDVQLAYDGMQVIVR